MQLKFFDAGELRTQMILEEQVETPDGQGGFTVVWTEIATLWAAIDAAGGRAESFAGRSAIVSTHTIWLRHRDDVCPGQRLRRGAHIYRVDQAEDADGSRRYLFVRATEEFA